MKRIMLMLLPIFLAACNPGLIQNDEQSKTGELGKEQNYASASDTYVKLAYEYLRHGDHSRALSKAKKAVARGPNNANAHLVLALVYETLGENGLANAAYQRSLKVDGKNPYALNAYGSYLCKLGEYQKAAPMFQRALDNPLYQTPWVALANAGYCASKSGNLALAESYLLKALERNPGYPTALQQMAQVRYDQQKYLSTRAYLERYRELAKPTASLLYLSILTERKLGDANQARSDEILLKSEFPDSEQARKLGY